MAITDKKNKKNIKGVVTGCERLNVRVRANSNAEIINILDRDAVVFVDPDTIGNKFYKISMVRHRERPLPDEIIEGYCMSEYISVPNDKTSSRTKGADH